MVKLGRILIADDEEIFLQSTADLLRREGYECDCVQNATEAAEKISNSEYDLLIADIKMPGNMELELVKNISNVVEYMPVILITGYPMLHSAIQSIKLRVEAYLVKPFDFEDLLGHVHIAVDRSCIYRSVRSMKQHLQYWYEGSEDIEKLLKDEHPERFFVSFNSFLELTFQNIVGALSDLKHLAANLAAHDGRKEPCHLLNCPTLKTLSDGLAETIDALEKSKSSFKSKELGAIRKKLEEIVNSGRR
jgi:YesN/AraC family two-component response regulator